ncbi:MAG TPA: YceI family protein [Pseudonocardiaceae bacterium]|jgi:polyisoprenoid-binding protein YceI|nr:YceI family protein [Pseudonocardiaceae bacterium]
MSFTIPGYVAGTWDIDPVHSDVSFVVRHVGLTRFRRSFEKFSGEIVTAENPAESSVTATVEVTSLDTGLEAFNRHLAGPDYLDYDNHPTAAFRSTGLRAAEENYALDGELTLRGVTRPVTFDVELLGFGEGMRGEPKTAFSASTTINRGDFGLRVDGKVPSGTLIIGEKVRILLEIEAVLRG